MTGCHRDCVTGFEVEHPACGNRKFISSQRIFGRMSHGDDFVVQKDRNPYRFPSITAPVNLFVDVVSSWDGHS